MKINYILLPLAIALILTIAVPSITQFVSAHGLGQSIEKTIGDYTVEVEYEAPELQAEEPVRLDFKISKKDMPGSVEFTDTWVRIAQGTETIFVGSIHNPEFGKAGMTFTFPESVNYELSVRFQNKDQTLAEASFPLTVAAGEKQANSTRTSQPYSALITGIIGLALGYGLSFLMKRKAST